MEVDILNKLLKSRIILLRYLLRQNKIDGIIISVPENRYYLSGFTGEDFSFGESAGALLITQKKLILATDRRYSLQASIEAPDYDILAYRSDITEKMSDILTCMDIKKIGFESPHVSYKFYEKYLVGINKARHKIIMVPIEGLVESIRIRKSKYEINQMRKALELAETAFLKLLTIIKPGMTERKTAWIFEKLIRDSGSGTLAFPIIVASGPNSAMPHAKITDRKLQIGEPILFDWGVKLGKYCSDTSRTLILGSPTSKFLNIHSTVYEAQKKAIASVKSGINTSTLDAIAREHINNTKYHGKFSHSLGHGIGLGVHEAPRISQSGTEILKSGMTITIEPGIYIPDWGGVRIENQLLVNKNSCQVLNKTRAFKYKIDN